MGILFLEYPKCSTCKKAKKWLDEHAQNAGYEGVEGAHHARALCRQVTLHDRL